MKTTSDLRVLKTLDFGLWTLDSLIVAGLLWAATAFGAENWPQFRGPEGDGHSEAKGLPLTWSETNHVKWKTPIHDRGWSSPVIWEGQIWLTTASEDGTKL